MFHTDDMNETNPKSKTNSHINTSKVMAPLYKQERSEAGINKPSKSRTDFLSFFIPVTCWGQCICFILAGVAVVHSLSHSETSHIRIRALGSPWNPATESLLTSATLANALCKPEVDFLHAWLCCIITHNVRAPGTVLAYESVTPAKSRLTACYLSSVDYKRLKVKIRTKGLVLLLKMLHAGCFSNCSDSD